MKKAQYILLFTFLFFAHFSYSQERGFHTKVSGDTLLMGNYLEVTFTLENTTGKIEPPSFESFELINGPAQSSSVSIINGNMTQHHSYTYILQAKEEGIFLIDPAIAFVGEEVIKTDPIQIVVLPNPDGIIQTPKSGRSSSRGWDEVKPQAKPKKPITKL
jgi:hypothetical protein